MSLSYLQLVKNLSTQLNQYNPIEAETLVNWLLEHHLGMRRVDIMRFLEEKDLPGPLKNDFERLKAGEPIQYILGHGPFYGREFKVSPATLIPRNETEELVHLIIKENPRPNLRILDIGTGSGCIPITLALEMQEPEVFGVDISEEALEIATFNAKKLKADVTLSKCDILLETPKPTGLDILVSNPPYIPIEEKKLMHQNVLDFEPHLALFVSDGDPLIFYKKIAETGMKLLKPFGKIYFEINERYGRNIADLLSESGYDKVRVIQDLNGKDRMVSGQISK
ncbi:release factor glutamine methyltransferase [Algoriphagus alkaliphilus]|uniref:Release factor glutamine methyltransferase n=1 Tax=Algoriphagus alkaliphilus TaxID=279824 RepID=A0A1G5YA73_9BACT|nr:peptide chain release factor N(5)-glutamine methyltransferase [Algoriphagus alkaliphilus]SDA79588.1 release factor glutamine methyltransferase [Algoriphagus alkaliphilus]